MSAPRPGDEARVSMAVAPAEAFRIFTDEIDLWWRRGLRYRVAGPARHGLPVPAFVAMWWGDLMRSMMEHVATKEQP